MCEKEKNRIMLLYLPKIRHKMSFYQKTLYFSRDMWYDSKKILPFCRWQLGGDKVRILICDDDARIREKIRECIKIYLQGIEVKRAEIVLFADGNELLKDKGQKDIVFLDIEMSGANGIYVGEKLKEANANVIIIVVTAYSEYLDDAMRFQVFRYLSKPLDRQRLLRNMKDAVAQYYSIQSMEKKIPIETKQGVHILPLSSIICVEAQGKKVVVHTVVQDFDSVQNMQYWQDKLPPDIFFRTHRSFLVNMGYVKEFDHSLVHLTGEGYQAYLTKRKYREFREAYLLYLEGMG